MTSEKRIGIEEARKVLGDLVTDAQYGNPTILTRNGKPVAGLVSVSDLADALQRLNATIRKTNASVQPIREGLAKLAALIPEELMSDTTVIASLNPGRSFSSYDLLDEITETYGLDRREAHESIHTFLSQIAEIDGDGVILAQEPQRPELLESNPNDVDVDSWITITAAAANGIREAFAATYASE